MTRRYTETNTIQTWPSGASFTYRGDPDGPENQRSLRIPGRNGEPDSPWRKGSPEEWRIIRIAVRAELYAAREILVCDSSLIDALIKLPIPANRQRDGIDLARAFSIEYDAIENLYADPSEWDLETCRIYISDNSLDIVGRHRSDVADDADLETMRDAIREYGNDNPAEVFEWWRVSEWLCGELRAIGQVVIDNDYGTWWGRCTTGQGFIMDGVLQQVAARYEREDR